MPSFHCKHPTCSAILSSNGYCPDHASQHQTDQQSRADSVRLQRRAADRKRSERNPELRRLYGSGLWKKTSRNIRASEPLCGVCENALAVAVHHIVKAKDDNTKWFDRDNLVPVCRACHEKLEGTK